MARLPSLPGVTSIRSTGPRLYKLSQEPMRYGPPGAPPPGFVTAKTSASEWPIYWALAQVFKVPPPEGLRQFPYVGGPPIWTYQAFADAGAERETNIDFVIWGSFQNALPVAIRIQTEFFHNFAMIDTQIYDVTQRERLSNGFYVVDIYDFDFLRDTTGEAAVIAVKRAMGMIERPNPIRSGAVQRV
jgi:hypothetical protein